MDENNLSIAFSDSLSDEITGSIVEFAEIGLDSIMEDGLLKDIPFISTAVSLFKIGKSLRERHYVSKLAVFLNEINKGIANEEKRQEYRQKIKANEKFRNKELEYVLVLIDRYISFDKPQMLAKLYLAYLDGIIRWIDFSKYAEIIDRILPDDLLELQKGNQNNVHYLNLSDALLRLISYGFIMESSKEIIVGTTLGSITIPAQEYKDYKVTAFGEQFLSIIN